MASTALSKAEQNALCVSYDVLGTRVELDLQFVKRYLVRGNPEKISDQEIVFFMNTCKMQKLNPLASGEVYCIKFGNEPAQMVVGKGAYLRRAFEHPDYLYKEEGITVVRGNEVIQKEGCCIYPGETLIGGWCRVYFMRNGKERTAYKEVALSEYDKGQANWKTKPATMIVKVATSQCVREAFPKDYEGIYSEEEMMASGAIPVVDGEIVDMPTQEDPPASKEQRQALFAMAQQHFGQNANGVLKAVLAEFGRETTTGMSMSIYNKVLARLMEIAEDTRAAEAEAASEAPAE
ncbi:MAG: phage recombination protein Bet [Oscillospiraceae bacterium]|nr:phage recombination protein Bet [Oscillospiraceae bacterium]